MFKKIMYTFDPDVDEDDDYADWEDEIYDD
jgi:hypothetical protein